MIMVSPALQAVPAPERLRSHRVTAAPDMAMAGGTWPENLANELVSVFDRIKSRT